MISTEGRRNSFYHQPVMPDEVRHYLISRPDGTYLDMTCGGGGHLRILSDSLSKKSVLIGIDRDEEAIRFAKETLKVVPQLTRLINSRFSEIDRVAEDIGLSRVDGILFDLGVSSHQIDSSERGFSFMHDGPLDMRMDKNDTLTAEEVINEYPAKELSKVFRDYGEERNPGRLVSAIISKREKNRIKSTNELQQLIRSTFSGKNINSILARLFQAIRIEVNSEMDELEEVLPKSFNLLASGGRFVCLSYHSLEDRIVKRFLQDKAKGCICPDNFPVCVCGRKPETEILTRRVVRPDAKEANENTRARSARLRAAQKI